MTNITPVQQERLLEQRARYTRPSFIIQVILVAVLLAVPWAFSSFRVIDLVAKIMIFTVFVASYDLLLGYSGLLSLGHSLFFGIGAYSLALVIYHSKNPGWPYILIAVVVSLGLSIFMALVIAFFSLRVKAIFFAMMTLALSEFAFILAVQWYDLTKAEDGVSFKLPGIFNVNWTAPNLSGNRGQRPADDLLFYPHRLGDPLYPHAPFCPLPGRAGPQGHSRQRTAGHGPGL